MTTHDDVTVLTGATGFVGSLVLERLIARGERVVALIRAADARDARRRLDELAEATWGDRDVVAHVEAVAADLEAPSLGLPDGAVDALARRTAAIVHCAASVRFDLPFDEAHAINVGGTERMVALAERARSQGASGRFVHVSTAYVHGRCTGLARESGPSHPPQFRNTYEQTKHLAEQVVNRLEGATIVRPSIVVGDSRTGWTSSFNVVYVPLHAMLSGAVTIIPAPPDAILDLVPVDQVVDVIVAALDRPGTSGVVQAVSGSMAPRIEQFMRLCFAHCGMPMAPFVPTAAAQNGMYAPYVDVWSTFQYGRGRRLGVGRTPIEELVPRMLDHAAAAKWGRRRVLRPVPRPLTVA